METDDPVLLLGSGLTMVDVMASLDAVSHRGAGPGPFAARPDAAASCAGNGGGGALATTARQIPVQTAPAVQTGGAAKWRLASPCSIPFGAQTQTLWQGLSLIERRRFLRRLRPYWDSHRHRLAPQMAGRLDMWLVDRLQIEAGRLELA